MIKLWELIIDGCWHQWRAMEKVMLVRGANDTIGHGTRYTYQCSKCHHIKKLDVK